MGTTNAAITTRRQIELFHDPLEPRVLPLNGRSFWTLNTLQGGRMEQKVYRIHDMEWVLQHVANDVDTYMSQGFFSRPCRRALHLAWLTHAYVDLDLYKLPIPPNPGEAGILLRLFCADEGIPEPSLIVFSGRGIYLKWMWSTPLPRAAAGRAIAINKALVRRFAEWGADPASVDVSRILRVVGTTNTKSGQAARVLWQADRGGEPLTYDFEMFGDEVLPYTMEQIRDFRIRAKNKAEVRILSHERRRQEATQHQPTGRRAFSSEDWHWGVVEDLRLLASIRSADGLVQPGNLDLFGHIGACQLAMVLPAAQLWHEVQAWSRIILPPNYANSDAFKRHSSTLLRKAQRAARGETDIYCGKRVSPIYIYSKSTMIERLGITSAEMSQMTRLIDASEKQRRNTQTVRAKRRAAGVQERISYETQAAERQASAIRLRDGGLSWSEVAERIGASNADAARQLALRGKR